MANSSISAESLLDVIHSHRLLLHDQDALCYVLRGKVSYLPWSWNLTQKFNWIIKFGGWMFQKVFFDLKSMPSNAKPKDMKELKSYCDNPMIFHFIGELKPWRINRELAQEKKIMYQETLIYSKKWLLLYAELAQIVKRQEVA